MSPTPKLALILTASGLLAAGSANAAYIIEANGTLGSANFAFTGDGTTASTSTASAGNLPATTDATPTFFTLAHVFGGDGSTFDQYTFTYSPGSDGDNTTFTVGADYNLPQGLESTGLTGGTAGIYNVYRIHPANPGVSGGNTLYELFLNGGFVSNQSIDQNAANLGTGENIGRWELIGNVAVSNPNDVVSVKMTAGNNTFTSMRASGIMFEYVSEVPEPSGAALSLLGGLLLFRRRRAHP